LSVKENVELIKQELSAEEQFFEKAVVTERFFNKYKKVIVVFAAVIVVGAIAKVGYDIKEANRIKTANEALLVLEKNPNDAQARATLQANSAKLFQLWQFADAIKKNDLQTLENTAKENLFIISDVASYHIASSKKEATKLAEYALQQNGIYKDLAIVDNATLALKEGKTIQMKEELALLPKDSALIQTAQILKHYGVK